MPLLPETIANTLCRVATATGEKKLVAVQAERTLAAPSSAAVLGSDQLTRSEQAAYPVTVLPAELYRPLPQAAR